MMVECDSFFVGIDPSLTGNAIVIINQDGKIEKEDLICTYKDCYISGEQRVLDIFEQIEYITNIVKLKNIYIEGLAYSSVSCTLFERCGLLYMITTELLKHDVSYCVVPPPALKKWHTTDGRADKKFMMRVAKCKWGIDFKDDNICDAYCLAMMARDDWINQIKREST